MKVIKTIPIAAMALALAAPSAEAHHSTSHLVRQAKGHPYACDFNHNNRWGQSQLQCVIIVIMPHEWESWALRVGRCESGGDHYVVAPPPNPSSGARGLFQFLASTWRTTPQYHLAYKRARAKGLTVYRAKIRAANAVDDPVQNTKGALWLVSTSGRSQWDCK